MKHITRRLLAFLLSVLMIAGLGMVFSSAEGTQAKYSDLFYVYDSKYLHSEALKNYYRVTGTVMESVLYDFYDSPVDMFLLEIKTAIGSLGFVDYSKLMSSAYGDNDFYYQAALDAVNLKLVEALSQNNHEDAFGIGTKAVKQMKSIGSFNKDFHDMFDGKTSTSIEQFNGFKNILNKTEYVVRIPKNTVTEIFDEIGQNLDKYKSVIGATVDVLEVCDTISVALALEEVKRDFIDDILEETNTDSLINSDLRRGFLRLKGQMDVGFVNYFMSNYLANKALYQIIKELGEQAINDAVPLYGMAVDALQALSKVVFDFILKTPGLDDYANLIVATKYTEDFWKILKNKQAKLNTHCSAEEVEEYRTVFCALSAANDITMDYSKGFTLGKNKNEFNQMCAQYKGYTYDEYIRDALSEINAIQDSDRTINKSRVFDHSCGTSFKDSSDTIEEGFIYRNSGTLYGTLNYHHDKNKKSYFWAAHPHYRCYVCSCGYTWEDRNEPNVWENCSICVAQSPTLSADTSGWLWPIKTSTTMSRGYFDGHQGIDILPGGSQVDVYASKGGKVIAVFTGCKNYSGAATGGKGCDVLGCPDNRYSYYDGKKFCNYGFGKGVIIDHGNGYISEYAHMSSVNVSYGQSVTRGQVLGKTGSCGASTGEHLHFTIAKNYRGHWGQATIINNNPIGNEFICNGYWNGVDTIQYSRVYDSNAQYTVSFDANGGELPGDTIVTYKVVVGDGLNVRSGASTSYSIIGTMSQGTSFSVCETMHDGTYLWGKHAYNGQSGWSVINLPGWAEVTGATINQYTDKKVLKGYAYGELPIPVRDGFIFAGWYTAIDGGTLVTSDTNVSISSNHILFARWITPADIKPGVYVIKQISSGGYINDAYADDKEDNFVGMHNQYNVSDNAQQMLLINTGSGYKISPLCSTSGRVLSLKSNELTNGNNVVLKTDISAPSQLWYFETTPGGFIIRNAQDTNYVLDGQGMDYSCTIKPYSGATSQKWKLYSLIRFDANDGENGPTEQLKQYDEPITITAEVPTRQDYTFYGWTEDLDDISIAYQPSASYTSEGAKTLYAIWAPDTSKVVSLEIVDLPDALYFEPGGTFDYSGLTVKVIRADGTESIVNDISNVAGFSAYTVGEQTITIGYEGRVAQYPITVAHRGDLTLDNMLNITDVTALLDHLAGTYGYKGVADMDDDGIISITDVTRLLDTLATPAEWVKASSLPAGAQILDRKWTYTRTQTKDELEDADEGWELAEANLTELASGSYQYAIFPSTFSKSHSLYSTYNKERLTGYTENGITRVVSDPVLKSYIYWHWCYESGTTTTFDRVITDQYHLYLDGIGKYTDYFYAFDSTTNYPWVSGAGAFKAQISGMNASSYWWFRFETYTQTYTDYQINYHYQKITEEESATEVIPGGEISNVVEWVKWSEKNQPKELTYNVEYVSSNGTNLGSSCETYLSGTTNTITAPAKAGYATPEAQEVTWDEEEKTITFVYVPEQVVLTKNGQFCNPPDEKFSITYACQNRTATSVDVVVTMSLTINNPGIQYTNVYSHWFATSVNGKSTGECLLVPFNGWKSIASDTKTVTKTITVPLTSTEQTTANVILEIWMRNYYGDQYGSVDRYNWTIDLPAF